MLDWLIETFEIIFDGASQLLSGALRIGAIVIFFALIYQVIKSLKDNPISAMRSILAFIVFFLSFVMFFYMLPFFITPKLINQYSINLPGLIWWIMLAGVWMFGWKFSFFLFEKIHPEPHKKD